LAQQIPPNMTWYMDGVPEVTSVQPGWSRMQVGFIGRLAMYIVGTAGLTDNSTPAPCSTELIDQGGFMWVSVMTAACVNSSFAYDPYPRLTYSLDGEKIYTGFIFYPAAESGIGYAAMLCFDKNGSVLWARKLTPAITGSGGTSGVVTIMCPTTDGDVVMAISQPFALNRIWRFNGATGAIVWQKSLTQPAPSLYSASYAPLSDSLLFYGRIGDTTGMVTQLNAQSGAVITSRRITVATQSGSLRHVSENPDGTFLVLFHISGAAVVGLIDSALGSFTQAVQLAGFEVQSGLKAPGGYVLAGPQNGAQVLKLDDTLQPVWLRGGSAFSSSGGPDALEVGPSGIIYIAAGGGGTGGPVDPAWSPLTSNGWTAALSEDGTSTISGVTVQAHNGSGSAFANAGRSSGPKTIHIPTNRRAGVLGGQIAPSATQRIIVCSHSFSYPSAETSLAITGGNSARYIGDCSPAQATSVSLPSVTTPSVTWANVSASVADLSFTSNDAISELPCQLFSLTL